MQTRHNWQSLSHKEARADQSCQSIHHRGQCGAIITESSGRQGKEVEGHLGPQIGMPRINSHLLRGQPHPQQEPLPTDPPLEGLPTGTGGGWLLVAQATQMFRRETEPLIRQRGEE